LLHCRGRARRACCLHTYPSLAMAASLVAGLAAAAAARAVRQLPAEARQAAGAARVAAQSGARARVLTGAGCGCRATSPYLARAAEGWRVAALRMAWGWAATHCRAWRRVRGWARRRVRALRSSLCTPCGRLLRADTAAVGPS